MIVPALDQHAGLRFSAGAMIIRVMRTVIESVKSVLVHEYLVHLLRKILLYNSPCYT